MKKLTIQSIVILWLVILFAGCDKSSTDEIEIYDDGTTQLFVTNVDEQRCPIDLLCDWEGYASVDLRIANESASEVITLSTLNLELDDLVLRTDTTIFNSTITLTSILPIPNSDQVLDIDEYTIDVEVEY